jgi:hypothetical protein
MPRRTLALSVAVLIALVVASCGGQGGTGAGAQHMRGGPAPEGGPAPAPMAGAQAAWARLRLASGATLPYPGGWRRIAGDPGTVSAALYGANGLIRAYLNATPADGRETRADWTRFRLRHNAGEGNRDVRLQAVQARVRLTTGRAACIVDDYTTSRARYRERACLVEPPGRDGGTVLIAAAQAGAWTQERPLLDRAIEGFTSARADAARPT